MHRQSQGLGATLLVRHVHPVQHPEDDPRQRVEQEDVTRSSHFLKVVAPQQLDETEDSPEDIDDEKG